MMESEPLCEHQSTAARTGDDLEGLGFLEKSTPPPDSRQDKQQLPSLSRFTKLALFIAVGFITLVSLFAVGYSCGYRNHETARTPLADPVAASKVQKNCTDPAIRKEWRTLSSDEKQDYIDAFQCFIDSPSMLGMNGTLYNDFSWVHNLVAHNTHGKAPFLTWHRRFISVYEKTLREQCSYQNPLPFWDWTLDWETLPASPIFAPGPLGFGTDGNASAAEHGGAHCVTDHPFANLQPAWRGDEYDPHCLTRSYAEDWGGEFLNPDRVAEVLARDTYEEFFLALEMRTHDIIPMGAGGDFTIFTAPNDPVFYLHHVQLDRLWWLWQMRDKENRLHSYAGIGAGEKNVTMSDTIPLAGLDQDVTVAEIMDTEGGDLCYRYMYV